MALIGNTIGIKPILLLQEGAIVKEGMTKRIRKTLEEKLPTLINEYPVADYDYTVVRFDVEQEKLQLTVDVVAAKVGQEKVMIGALPINVCAHCGPGTTGLVISPKINGKSLAEFF